MNASFSSRIKELRTSLKMTQANFATSINSAQTALSAYENGDRVPSYEILLEIANKYNVSIDWLCGLSNKKSLNLEVTTYADAFEILVKLCSTKYINDTSEPGNDFLYIQNIDNSHGLGDVTFKSCVDINVSTFFSEWLNIYPLYKKGTIDKELYTLWLEKKLAEYNRPIDGAPF